MKSKNTGKYTVVSVSKDNIETVLHEENNIIPNNGLDLICSKGSQNLIYKCVVSSDPTPPTQDTNQIPSIVATTSTVILREWGARDTAPYYYWYRTTFEFAPSQANGNLTKIGVTDASDSVFSVSLFKDLEGKPTTIQPIENERLRVIYEHRVFLETSDVVYKSSEVIPDDPTEYTFTIRPAHINASVAAQNLNRGLYIENYHSATNNALTAFEGPIGAITGMPSGRSFYSDSIQSSGYIGGTYKKPFSINLDYKDFNTSLGISSFYWATSRGCFQVKVDPPIKKDNTQKMTITFPMEIASK